MKFLGIDTAQVNLGIAVIEKQVDGSYAVTFEETFKPKEEFRESDFIRNNDVVQHIRYLQDQYGPFIAAGVESAALSAKKGMFTIGTIHGAILQALMDLDIAFIYSTPNKLKYFCRGPAKGGPWGKKPIMDAVKDIYGKSLVKGGRDSNRADAIVLATMAITATLNKWGEIEDYWPSPWDEKWARHIFLSTQKNKNTGKLAGIFHRPGDFFWRP